MRLGRSGRVTPPTILELYQMRFVPLSYLSRLCLTSSWIDVDVMSPRGDDRNKPYNNSRSSGNQVTTIITVISVKHPNYDYSSGGMYSHGR